MATTGDLANLSNDVYYLSGAPTGWTRLSGFTGDGGFFGAVYRNTNGETFAVMRGMELSLLDAGAVGQVKIGIKPLAFDVALDFFKEVNTRFGNTVTYVGHSLGGAMVDYIAAFQASQGTRVTGITFGAIGINSILSAEGLNGVNLNDRLTNYVHPIDIAKTVGVGVGTQVEVPYTRGWADNLGALFGLVGLFGEATRQHLIQSYQQTFSAQGTLTFSSSHFLGTVAIVAASSNGQTTYAVNADNSVTAVTTEFLSGGQIKSVQTSHILANGNVSSTTVDANNNVTATVTLRANQADQSATIVRKNFNVAGQVESEGTMRLDRNGRATLDVSGNGFDAIVNNTVVTIQAGAQATINGDGSYLLGLGNSTVQTTTFNSTIVTAAGGSSNLIALGSNNNLILGTGTTVDLRGNNNTVIGPVHPGSVQDHGSGNQILTSQNLSPDVSVQVISKSGFNATINLSDVVFVSHGGLFGGSVDGTRYRPGPDPEDNDEDGGSPDPDPLINGHAFLIGGDLQIIAGDGDNSIQGGLENNVIVVGGGNNLIEAPGTENIVSVGGGNNIVGVGGVASTVAVGEGQNYVTDLSQNGVVLGGAGNVVVDFGVGNHTIIGGTGAALTTWDSRLGPVDPGIGIAFANIIRGAIQGDAAYFTNLQSPVHNRLIGGPNSNYIQGGLGNNTIDGGDSADRLIGGISHYVFGGHDVIHGGGGNDSISGGVGGDATLYGDGGDDIIDGGFSRSTIYGGNGNDTIRAGSSYDNVLFGEAGDDELRVGLTSGNVTLDGGIGNDRLIGTPSSSLQTFVFGSGYGHDTVEGVTSRAVVSLTPGVLPDDLTLQTNSDGDLLASINGTGDQLTIHSYFVQGTYTITFSDGTSWNRAEVVNRTPGLVVTDTVGGQIVQGSPLADTLSGPGGNDTLIGGRGGDTYLVELGHGVTTIDDLPDGDNLLSFGPGITEESVSFFRDDLEGTLLITYGTQGDAVRLLHFDPFNPVNSLGIQLIQSSDGLFWDTTAILNRIPGLVLTDVVGGQILQGSSLADTLSGPGGNATLAGGDGNDTYLFDRGYGRETIFDQDLSGDALNTIRLGASIAPTDVAIELSTDGHLLLNINGGTDQLVITNFRERPFQAFQIVFDDGTAWDRDALIAQVASFPLVADQSGSALTGSDLSDTLIGLGGNDFLDGLGGEDVMAGGAGNDLYYVENPGDQVIELPGQGRDSVRSFVDYTLPDNVENLQLSYSEFSGPIPIVGIGNAENNDLRGNFQNNILQGGIGNDTLWGGFSDVSFGPGNDDLAGGAGNDTYYVDGLTGNGVDTIHDVALPGEGNRLQLGSSIRPSDLSFAQSPGSLFVGVGTAGDGVILSGFDPTNGSGSIVVETISFTGGLEQTSGGMDLQLADFLKPAVDGTAGDDALAGTSGVDVIRADVGDDVITGGQGNDVLIGGGGQDTFVFNQGDGSDLIDDVVQPGEANRVVFGFGITPDMLHLQYGGTANQGLLTLHIGAGSDALNFLGFLPDDPAGARAIDTLEFADGSTLLWDQLFTQGVDVRGTSGDDGELFGTFANDHMVGFAGEESLSSGAGNDVLEGGTGNDFLLGSSGADTYIYNLGDGRDQLEDEAEQVLDSTGNLVYANNRIVFGQGITLTDIDLMLDGGSLFIGVGTTGDGLNIGSFVDTQPGIRSLDFADGLSLNLLDLADALLFTDEDRVLTGGDGSSTVFGGNGNDLLTGGSGPSLLIGWEGNDVLTGGIGTTRFYSGAGNDLLKGSANESDTYVFNRGDGSDTIQDVASAAAGNRIQFGSGIAQGDLIFTQDQAAKKLTIQVGSSGLDVIHLESFALTSVDGSVVTQTLTFADGSTVELADLLATPGVVTGTAGNDLLPGTSGNETLTGSAGNDTLVGGAGDDTYVFNAGDGIDTIADTAAPGEGNTLQFGPGITPEDLSLGLGSLLIRVGTNGDAVHLTTLNPNDVLGAHTIDLFRFADGSTLSYDQLIARGFDLTGTIGDDTINGTNVSDRITGLAGNDTLVGSQGADVLEGGLGDDSYSVDSLDDVVTEQANEGTDKVLSAVSYTLGANIENLTLAGGSAINGTGNELDNILIGNRGNNILDGGLGTDTMSGGAGHDIYIVNSTGDVVTENANEGTDLVQSSLSYTLGDNVENLRLTASDNLNGTGNVSNNVLVGNSGNNMLDGSVGNDRLHGAIGTDTLLGGAGDDTYRFDLGDGVDTIEDTATVGEGNRILFGTGISRGDLTLTQDQVARTLMIQVGNSGTDKLLLANFDPTGVNGSFVVETLAFADGSMANLADLLSPAVNQAPTVGTPLADQTVPEDAPFSIQVPANTFADPDAGEVLTLSASLANGNALPTWLGFNPTTRTFSGTPDDAQVGTLDLRVTATDTGNLTASDVFTLTVTNVNEASTVVAPLADQTATEDAAFTFMVPGSTFADVDQVHGDTLTYYATLAGGAALPTWLSFDPITRTFSGTPLNIHVGTLAVTVTATDSGQLSVSTGFTLAVQNVNDAPTVATPLADQTVSEDVPFNILVPANTFADQDAGAVLTLSASLADGTALPTWLTFNAATATFSGTPDDAQVGNLDLRVTATDHENLSVSDIFTLTVANVNEAPTVAVPLADQMVLEDAPFSLQIPATTFADPDAGEVLTYSAALANGSALPTWLTFNAAIRTFSGTPDDAQVGSLDLRVTATDTGNLSASDVFTLTVANVNEAPTVVTQLADQQATEDAPFSLVVPTSTFADVDPGDTLTYGATLAGGAALPTWLSFDSVTRTLSGTPGNSDVGNLEITVNATDLGGLSATDTFALTIQNVNDAPTVAAPLADQSALEDAAFTFTVPGSTFADVDHVHGDTFTYSATLAGGAALPTWLSFDSLTCTFSGTPLNGDVGTLDLTVTATDQGNLSASIGFSLAIQNVNDAPTVAVPIADQTAAEDSAFTVTIPSTTFADEDVIHGDVLTYSATLANGSPLPTWLSFNPTARTLSGTSGAGDAGTVQIAVRATDSGTLSATDTFALVISGPLPKTLVGTAGNDVLIGGRGDDTLTGLAGNDTLNGGQGHDLLDGGTGTDTMIGGSGNDTYVVDAAGDIVTELANEGMDTVQSSLTYTLGNNVENLTFTGTANLNGTGNALDNILTGNSGINVLTGGAGNDTYLVSAGDTVAENAGGGTDTVQSAVAWTLSLNVENLTLIGTANVNGTGSSGNNVLLGNSGNNTLDGGSGNDTADGGEGNDSLLGGSGDDQLLGGLGTDTLNAGSGNDLLNGGDGIDTLDGGSGDDQLLGGAGNDTLTGGSGADQFTGGTGNDTMTGGSGNDRYTFARGDGQDTIIDADPFPGNQDRLLYGATINPHDLVLSRQVNDLRLAIHGSSDQITVQNWYTSPTTNQIETIQAGNGQALLNSQVDQLIQAMAGFSAQTGLTWDQALDQRPQDVQTVLAASWQ
jgi:Ca2+-binding RTX toxin-like protein